MAASDPSLPLDRIGSPTTVVPKSSPLSSKLSIPVTAALVIAALYFGRDVLVPLALAILLSFVFTPIVAFLERRRLGRVLSMLLVLGGAFIILVGLGWMVSGQLIEIAGRLPTYEVTLRRKFTSISGPKHGGLAKAVAAIKELENELTGASKGSHKAAGAARGTRAVPVRVVKPPTGALSELRAVIGPALGPLGTAGIVIVFTIFMLAKREDLRSRVIRFAGRGRLNLMTAALDDGARRLSRYYLLQVLVNSSYGVLVGVVLYFIGVPHALLWGVLTGLLRFIPYVGILIAASLPIAMALAVFPGWSQAILTICLYAVLEVAVGSFIEPILYGSHTGISSLAILVAALFWTMLWGPVGLVLSTPLTVCVVVLGRHVPHLQFLEIALGDEPALAPEAHFYQRLLAMDEVEAHDIADEYLKEKPLESFYETVLIPALGMAEQDRHANVLDEERHVFICQTLRELVEELGERTTGDAPPGGGRDSGETGCAPGPGSRSGNVLCIPARDDADEIAGMVVAQLAQREVSRARFIPIGSVADMIEQVAEQEADVVCVSALPPAALGQARSLCKRLRGRFPELKIVLGLWNFEGGRARAQERSGTAAADLVGTTLIEVVLQIRQLAGCVSSAVRETQHETEGRPT